MILEEEFPEEIKCLSFIAVNSHRILKNETERAEKGSKASSAPSSHLVEGVAQS